MFDDNCSLHTAAAISNMLFGTSYKPRDVSDITGFMEGPVHGANSIANMFQQLKISDGTYIRFDSFQQAIAFMGMNRLGTPYGFGYLSNSGTKGHILVAVRSHGTIEFRDHQLQEINCNAPIGVSIDNIPQVGHTYYVFRPGIVTCNNQ